MQLKSHREIQETGELWKAPSFCRVVSQHVTCNAPSRWSYAVAAEFGASIAEQFRSRQIETVASPAIGGIVIGYEVARQLGVRFIWTEREGGRMTLRRGFQVHEDERVLVVEDVITTGGSTRETIATLTGAVRTRHRAAFDHDRSGGKAGRGCHSCLARHTTTCQLLMLRFVSMQTS